jgi:putative ABC transport system permease protein
MTWLEPLLEDVRSGIRLFYRNGWTSAVVVLTLGIGIGMNTLVFTVFDTVLVRPLPYPDPDRLLWISTYGGGLPPDFEAVEGTEFGEWRKQAASFEGMVLYDTTDQTLGRPEGSDQSRIALVSEDFWKLTGARPALGRLPEPGERDALLLSQAFFARAFSSDPRVVGRPVTVNGRQAAIVGVLPAEFSFQLPERTARGLKPRPVEVYRSIVPGGVPVLFKVVARLKPGVSIDAARAELQTIRTRLAQQRPPGDESRLRVMPLRDRVVGEARTALWILLGAVLLVLLVACANVANLLLARASTRQREMAVRTSIGAAPGRLVRQLLGETLALALPGLVAGVLLAWWGLGLLVRVDLGSVPRLADSAIDGRVLGFAVAISLLTALLAGLGSAIPLRRANITALLSESAGTVSSASRSVAVRQLLVASELAIAVVLLTGAGLMLKSFWQLNARAPAFHPEQVLLLKIPFSGPVYRQLPPRRAYADELLRRLRALPDVAGVSLTTERDSLTGLVVSGAPPSPPGRERPPIVLNATSAAFVDVLGTRVIRGRWISDTEPQPVIAINETVARAEFANEDPLGKRVELTTLASASGPFLATVVGVVADQKYARLDADPDPEIYLPYAHSPELFRLTVLVRTTREPVAVAAAVRMAILSIDRTQPAYDVMTLERALSDSIASRRLNMLLLASFAAVALVLAVTGIYSVIAYLVSQRTREIGLRMVLGARRRQVIGMVVWQGMRIAGAGIVVGVLASLGLTRLIRGLLYEVEPTDVQTFTAVTAVLAITALLACWGPALRAALVDPIAALRRD